MSWENDFNEKCENNLQILEKYFLIGPKTITIENPSNRFRIPMIVTIILAIVICGLEEAFSDTDFSNTFLIIRVIVLIFILVALIYFIIRYYFTKWTTAKTQPNPIYTARVECLKARKQQIIDAIASKVNEGANISKVISDLFLTRAIAVDSKQHRWFYIIPDTNSAATLYDYRFSDLLQYELYEDGIQQLSGNSENAAAGAFFFGAAGAVVGASGAQTIDEKCMEMYISITVNDLNNSRIKWECIQKSAAQNDALSSFSIGPIEKNTLKYKSIKENVQDILSVLAIIRNFDSLSKQKNTLNTKTIPNQIDTNQPSATAKNEDVYSQIEKLYDLKEKGILTEEEFNAKKRALLHL